MALLRQSPHVQDDLFDGHPASLVAQAQADDVFAARELDLREAQAFYRQVLAYTVGEIDVHELDQGRAECREIHGRVTCGETDRDVHWRLLSLVQSGLLDVNVRSRVGERCLPLEEPSRPHLRRIGHACWCPSFVGRNQAQGFLVRGAKVPRSAGGRGEQQHRKHTSNHHCGRWFSHARFSL